MMRRRGSFGWAAILTAVLFTGCDDGPGNASGTDSTGGSCEPGYENCPCNPDNLCFGDLVCEVQICVDPGDSAASSATSDGDTFGGSDTSGSDSDTGTWSCQTSEDCLEDEICVDEICFDATAFYYDVSVVTFDPMDCSDGWGSAELIFYYYEDGVEQQKSSEALCPADWSNEPLFYDALKTFRLEFWEADAFFDDYLTSLCWSDGGDCGPIPPEILHDGEWFGLDGSGQFYLDLTFTPSTPYE